MVVNLSKIKTTIKKKNLRRNVFARRFISDMSHTVHELLTDELIIIIREIFSRNAGI